MSPMPTFAEMFGYTPTEYRSLVVPDYLRLAERVKLRLDQAEASRNG